MLVAIAVTPWLLSLLLRLDYAPAIISVKVLFVAAIFQGENIVLRNSLREFGQLRNRKRKIEKRLERRNWENQERPMFRGISIGYEMEDWHKGIGCGGIGVIHVMAKRLGLTKQIDKHLHLLKRHLPYHESDHVLNVTYNVLAGGTLLEDIELQRQDEGWMDALGAEIIPDPTTAGDFLRVFQSQTWWG